MVLPGPVAQTAANQTLSKCFHGHLLAATHNQMPRNRDSSSSTDLAETQTGATGVIHQKVLKLKVLKPKVLKLFANPKVLKVQRY